MNQCNTYYLVNNLISCSRERFSSYFMLAGVLPTADVNTKLGHIKSIHFVSIPFEFLFDAPKYPLPSHEVYKFLGLFFMWEVSPLSCALSVISPVHFYLDSNHPTFSKQIMLSVQAHNEYVQDCHSSFIINNQCPIPYFLPDTMLYICVINLMGNNNNTVS